MDIANAFNKAKLAFTNFISAHSFRTTKPILENNLEITQGFSDQENALFLSLGTEEEFAENSYIFYENESAESLYIIVEGEAEVIKQKTNEFGDEQLYTINTLQKDAVVGDMALIERKPRSASLRAKSKMRVLRFKLDDIEAHPKVNLVLTQNLAKMLSGRLRYTNEVTVKNMEKGLNEALARNALGVFMVVIFWLISVYTISLTTLIEFKTKFSSSTPLSVSLIFIFAVGIFIAMRQTGIPMKRFGLTLDDWKRKVLQAILYTLPLMLLFTAIKLDLVYFSDNPHHITLFSGPHEFVINGTFELSTYLATILLYTVFSPIQELITRCAMQTTFFLFLPGSEVFRKWNAIILSNLIFSAVHSHMSLVFAVAAFLPGIFWGWLFHKQRSFLGVSVSHILLGVWVLFIIGIGGII